MAGRLAQHAEQHLPLRRQAQAPVRAAGAEIFVALGGGSAGLCNQSSGTGRREQVICDQISYLITITIYRYTWCSGFGAGRQPVGADRPIKPRSEREIWTPKPSAP